MNSVKSNTFPFSSREFVASVWLQNQDLTGKTPVEIWDMYNAALSEIEQADESGGSCESDEPDELTTPKKHKNTRQRRQIRNRYIESAIGD